MESGKSARVAEIQRLRDAAWEAIGSATKDRSVKRKYWKSWQTHCQLYQTSGSSIPPTDTKNMLLTFAVAVREVQYGLGRQVKVQSVEKALRAIAQKYVLVGHQDPPRSSPAQHALDLPIAPLLKKFGKDNPPEEPKLAIPILTVKKIARQYHFSGHLQGMADLCIIAVFYLLQAGEYTTPALKEKRRKRTISLQKCDIRLWCKGHLLNPSSGLAQLLTADSATICIANTKNWN